MTNLGGWEARAWWVLRNPLDDLTDAAEHLVYTWRHYRDWERLMADDLEEAQSERAQGLLQWHRKRIAEGIVRLQLADDKARALRLIPGGTRHFTPDQMAERYTPWPPMQTREEAEGKA
jgi:hypothetical protein